MSSWRTLVVRLGEKGPEYGVHTDIPTQIETCLGFLLRDIEEYGDEIAELVLQCAEELPHKSPYYATLVGLLNLEYEEFGAKLVEQVHTKFQDALEKENCDKIRLLLRFLTILMCNYIIPPGSLIEVFETLLSSAATTIDEEKGNPCWQARADFYIYCLLACLPWGGLELYERVQDELERVMAAIEAYLRIRKPVRTTSFSPLVKGRHGHNKDDKLDMLEDLWSRIKLLRENEWKVASVPRPHLDFEARLISGKNYEFGSFSCPKQPAISSNNSDVSMGRQRNEAALKYPERIRRLHIFPVSESQKDMEPIDRFVLEEYILDILFYLDGCRKECAQYLVGLPVTFRYEYMMAETIFSQMFLLPKSPFKLVFYTLVIIDLCKALPGAFPAVVAAAVRTLFDRVAELDIECQTRFVQWFSQHLSNFQFIWPWEEWLHVLQLPKWSRQRCFTQEVLEKEVRLSYWEKIKQSLENAPALEELLPPKDSGPCLKYSGKSQEGKSEVELTLYSELNSILKERKSSRDLYSWIEEKIISVHGNKTAIEVVAHTLFYIGSKSLTHLSNVLEKYGQLLTKLGSDPINQVLVIDEIAKLWQRNPQMTVIAIDRMMGYRIISNLSIVKWVFSPPNVEQFHTSGILWEILQNALQKTFNRISDLRGKVASAEEAVRKAVNAVSKAEADVKSAEKVVEDTEGSESQAKAEVKLRKSRAFFDKCKDEESSAQEQLEVSDALLSRELQENEGLLVNLYKSFIEVLMKHNLDKFQEVQTDIPDIENGDSMAVDTDGPSPMDADDDTQHRNERPSQKNTSEQEEQEWCLVTLGHLQSLTRHYATEVWTIIEKLDAEVFTDHLHPLIKNTVYSSLQRSIPC